MSRIVDVWRECLVLSMIDTCGACVVIVGDLAASAKS